MKSKIFTFLLVAVLVFVLATPALADGPSRDDPNAQIGRVETFERVTWTKTPTSDGISVAVSGCKTYTQGVNGYSMGEWLEL